MDELHTSRTSRLAENDEIDRLLNQVVASVKGFTETQLDHVKRLTRVGTALSAEKRLDRLVEMIVEEARRLTNADGGSLYTVTDDEKALGFSIVQNDSMQVRMGGMSGTITWTPVPLWTAEGIPNHSNVCAHAVHTGRVLNVPDVYDTQEFTFHGPREFDASTGYLTRSMLVVPMRNHENQIIGVLQLLNARDGVTGALISFSLHAQEMTECLASQAAIALTNNRLIQDLEALFQAFIKALATAVEEKSPHTGGHVRRVAELTMAIAEKINEATEGPFAHVHFDEDQMKELQIAAWLHDVGKVTTLEHVVEKATKLQTVYDRIEEVRTRFEVVKRDLEIRALRRQLAGEQPSRPEAPPQELDEEIRKLDEEFMFLVRANRGDELMDEERIQRLRSIARRRWELDGEIRPLLDENELENLSVRRGTLTAEEREIVNHHATVTLKMLSQLPFPRKMRNVPTYAAAHHEKLDGTGYPLGLRAEELPLQSRIMALADIFEALTAGDRPYRKPDSLSEALGLLAAMTRNNHVDPDLYELFVQEKVYLDYAHRELGL